MEIVQFKIIHILLSSLGLALTTATKSITLRAVSKKNAITEQSSSLNQRIFSYLVFIVYNDMILIVITRRRRQITRSGNSN